MPFVGVVAGSNIDADRNIVAGLAAVAEILTDARASSMYRGPAAGPTGQPDFLNAVIVGSTDLGAIGLRGELRRIEAAQGRVRTSDKYAPRSLDLDIIFYGSLAVRTPELRIPDPDALAFAHIALPLAEVFPEWRPPGGDRAVGHVVAEMDTAALQRVP